MDRDVVFVGEIRDEEAANIGMRAAGSGKYVFSTMHTRDVASTITALHDMQVGDRSIADNVSGIVNQRLVRRLCRSCLEGYEPNEVQRNQIQSVGIQVPDLLFGPVGCVSCHGTGFHGRIGIYEVAKIGPEVRDGIVAHRSTDEIETLLRSGGTQSLEFDAMTKATSGLISFEDATGIRWLG